jgi:hypothetical protein
MTLEELRKNGHVMTEAQWMIRILFLETIAGVPGFTAAMIRHLRGLRMMVSLPLFTSSNLANLVILLILSFRRETVDGFIPSSKKPKTSEVSTTSAVPLILNKFI